MIKPFIFVTEGEGGGRSVRVLEIPVQIGFSQQTIKNS